MDKKISKRIKKTISWRLIAITLTISIALVFTGQIGIAFGIGTIEFVIKLIGYYFHEKFWDNKK